MQQTISLYLELKPGEKPDFEVVGLSAAAFAEAVKEIAYIIDPGLDVRLEFESGTKGSLSLNAILKTLGSEDGRRGTLYGIILGVAAMFVNDARQWTTNRFLDSFFPPDVRLPLTDDEIDRIARAIRDVSDGKIARVQRQKVFRQLDREPAINSVGTITQPDMQPPDPVPRTEFQARAGVIQPQEVSPRTRIGRSTEKLTLVSPVLLPADRVWRFQSPFGEFSYHLSDEKFLGDLLSGRRRLPMKAGIQITVDIETHEAIEGGVWVPKRRVIVKVKRVHRERERESELFAQPKKRKRSKNKKQRS
jgi:hypothetical protein